MDLEQVIQNSESQMLKSVDAFKKQLAQIRTGRAHTSLLEGIRIDYYGTSTPLSQIASVQVVDPRTLTVKSWESHLIKEIEKSIRESNLGLNPQIDSDLIRVPIPQLNEQRRKELVKQAKQKSEETKVAVRNIRRSMNDSLKNLVKLSELSENIEKKGLKQIQDMTDRFIAQIDALLAEKEADIMQV